MRVNFIILTLVFSIFVSFSLTAQNSSEKKANEAFDNGEWAKAIDLYKVAYTNTEDDVRKSEIIFKSSSFHNYMMINHEQPHNHEI